MPSSTVGIADYKITNYDASTGDITYYIELDLSYGLGWASFDIYKL